MAVSWLQHLGSLARRIAARERESSAPVEAGQSSDSAMAGVPVVAIAPVFAGGPEGFWEFSVEVYARPGVAPACLRLQDRDGLDVNLVLFAIWAGGARGALTAAELARAVEVSLRWREGVVGPLRSARRALKAPDVPVEVAGAATLRTRVKAAELSAEKLQQHMLAPLAEDAAPPAGRAAAEANLAACMAAAGLETGGPNAHDTAADAVILLDAAFGAGG